MMCWLFGHFFIDRGSNSWYGPRVLVCQHCGKKVKGD